LEARNQTKTKRNKNMQITSSLLLLALTSANIFTKTATAANAFVVQSCAKPTKVSIPTTGSSVTSSYQHQQQSDIRQRKRLTAITTTISTTTDAADNNIPRGGGGGASGGDAGSISSVGDGTATIPNEVFNLIKSIVGAGVLSLPYGVAAFGNAPSAMFPAVILITFMGALSAYTFGLIGRICQQTNTASYADAWDVTVGTSSSWLVAFSCFIDCFAGNLSYSMILADTIQNLAASAGFAITRTSALLGVTATVLTPLCLLKNLSSLAPFSLVGIIGTVYTAAAMGLRYFGKAYQPGGMYFTSQLTTPIFGTAGASAALGPKALILACMLSNAYIAHFNAPKFLNELKNNTMARFNQVIAWSFGASVAIYSLMTAFGFLTFGTLSLFFLMY
jgi:amino acid permease